MIKKIKVSKKININGTYAQMHNMFSAIQENSRVLEKSLDEKIIELTNKKEVIFKYKEFEIDKDILSLHWYYEEIKEEKEIKKNGSVRKIPNRRSNRATKK